MNAVERVSVPLRNDMTLQDGTILKRGDIALGLTVTGSPQSSPRARRRWRRVVIKDFCEGTGVERAVVNVVGYPYDVIVSRYDLKQAKK